MNTEPFVVIVMPAFDCGPYIAAAIGSIVAQTHRNWQLVIVDDGSRDDTGAIADEFARREPTRIRVIHQANAGIARARNRALAEARQDSEYTSFLDSDDVWFPGTLSTMVAALRGGDAGLVGVHGFRTYIDRDGNHMSVNGADRAPVRRRAVAGGHLRVLADGDPTTFEVLAYGCCIFTGALLIRSDAIRRAGLFDPDAVPAEDWDMWLRLSLRGPFGFVREPLYGYRLHGANSTANTVRKNNSLYYVRRKLATDAQLTRAARATMMAGFRWYELYRASVCFRELSRRLQRGRVRGVSATLLSGFRHLWTSVLPGSGRLATLGAESGDRLRA